MTQLRPTSLRVYRNAIRRYLKPRLGAVPLSGLDRRTLERVYAQLRIMLYDENGAAQAGFSEDDFNCAVYAGT